MIKPPLNGVIKWEINKEFQVDGCYGGGGENRNSSDD